MKSLKHQRQIVDRLALQEAIEAALEDGGIEAGTGSSGAIFALLQDTTVAGTAEIYRRFDADRDGPLVQQGRCFLVDQLLRVICDTATRLYPAANPTAADRLCVVAYGGYGRGGLAPHSDIDLLFLLPWKMTPRIEQIIEHTLYVLWDLKFKVGHATRSIEDSLRQARDDVVIRTGLLESRYVWGDQALHSDLRARFFADAARRPGDFVEAKLRERDERHERLGDSRYVLEPDIKNGKGGQRDLQTLFWIAKYLYREGDPHRLVEEKVFSSRELARFNRADKFLSTLRCRLHYLTGRAEERLTFDLQPQLAEWMGYSERSGAAGVERFMRHYFLVAKDVGSLTRIFCAALEARHQSQGFLSSGFAVFRREEIDGFRIDNRRLSTQSDEQFRERPLDMLRLFEVSQRTGLDIHPDALRLITRDLKALNRGFRQDPEANRVFMNILTARKNPEQALQRMNEAEVLGQFITDFRRVVAQMQFDMYHVYTTDQHTIYAIGILNRIENGEMAEELPLSTEIISKVLSREVLYVAVFLHDIAKGRGGDHSEIGANIARTLCPRLGLDPGQTETVSWLVLHHLAMSDTAFKRDLSDPKTIENFAELVRSPERLRLLLCLTVVDIRAVGPGRWNGWKAALLRELYHRTEDVLTGGLDASRSDQRVERAQEALCGSLGDWSEEEIRAHLALGPPGYWHACDAETHHRHAHFLRRVREAGEACAVDVRVDASRSATEVTVFAASQPGLVTVLAGALAGAGANIVDARIITLNDNTALDVFWIQDHKGGVFSGNDRLARMRGILMDVLEDRLDASAALRERPVGRPDRRRLFKVPPRVLIDNGASDSCTVIEVDALDRPGLLFALARAVSGLGLQISSAKISTFGEQAVDAFYVKDAFGMKVVHEDRLEEIRETLLANLAEVGAVFPAGSGDVDVDTPASPAASEWVSAVTAE